MSIFKTILTGALTASLAFCGGWFGHSWFGGKSNPTPTPAPIVVPVVNPNDNSENQVIVDIGGTGTTTQDKVKAVTSVTSTKDNKLIQIITDLQKKVDTLFAKLNTKTAIDKTMPVTGSITAKFIEKKTNADLGSETKPLTGTAMVKGDVDNLKVKMDFNSQLTFAVNISKEPDKLWHVGLYAGVSEDGLTVGGFTQRDFKLTTIKKVDLLGFGRVEIDKEPKLLFGVEGNF